ncbi:uncharacterized protein PGTG_18213 [Puccinia graminis f. sp. tritici CRL 75-36-700-3]|uniref:Uncharacterized protein n=1 Tax=Puccinia graminis f. sp. tritici (strain CRL 75-36-700-3 / race SCCL) TaxID=418459 RepID=E3L823_PUCGT|nr:uncharacterized protein PGTG_18213 [Puccinia graminis f. sp. tritici CRL 75-36-700-3]EFP92698.1 hypothetical protein PGTG_18213 [Puccinia graminis f. sp. tritici CRL 75-36-700-3]
MTDKNLPAHLEDMAKTFERLSLLVTSEAPLTPNNIYLSSILTSLPLDWLSCVSSMKNEPRVNPERDHKSQQAPPKTKRPGVKRANHSNKPSTVAKNAGCTLAAPLICNTQQSDDESDFSGSELKIRAGQAAVSFSVGFPSILSGDANLDLGCSISMTPDLSSVHLAKANNTPVHLADHPTVEASHKGVSRLPIKAETSVPTLVVLVWNYSWDE